MSCSLAHCLLPKTQQRKKLSNYSSLQLSREMFPFVFKGFIPLTVIKNITSIKCDFIVVPIHNQNWNSMFNSNKLEPCYTFCAVCVYLVDQLCTFTCLIGK